jgi:uncharacterized ParB-like nuclease family protein
MKKYVPKPKLVNLSEIMVLPELQVRDKLDEATVEEYVERLKRGEKAPPIEVWDAGKEHDHRLAIVDGCHRFEAAKRMGGPRSRSWSASTWAARGPTSARSR